MFVLLWRQERWLTMMHRGWKGVESTLCKALFMLLDKSQCPALRSTIRHQDSDSHDGWFRCSTLSVDASDDENTHLDYQNQIIKKSIFTVQYIRKIALGQNTHQNCRMHEFERIPYELWDLSGRVDQAKFSTHHVRIKVADR